MLTWWRRILRRDPPLLRGTGSNRARTYSADSGYAYQYVFAGMRRRERGRDSRTEYVFEVSAGRSPAIGVTVCLADRTMAASIGQERALTASERYGVAKIALKRALDRFEHPAAITSEITPDEEELVAIGEVLDL